MAVTMVRDGQCRSQVRPSIDPETWRAFWQRAVAQGVPASVLLADLIRAYV
jgi:hypothetical protein